MAKRFCGSGFASVKAVTRFSSSIRTAIADTAAAATNDAGKPADSATNGALKGGSRSSRPSAGVLPSSSSAIVRDGSRFPFDHFPGIIRLWMGRCGKASSGAAVLAGITAVVVAALVMARVAPVFA
jgi:hypothetical protein